MTMVSPHAARFYKWCQEDWSPPALLALAPCSACGQDQLSGRFPQVGL